MKTTITTLQKLKANQQPIVMLTAYDACFAKVAAEAGVDIILIGDSLGNVIQGKNTTVSVTTGDISYHLKAVVEGNASQCFLVADMPFMTYGTEEQALSNAASLMQAGAMMVKLEGGAWVAPTIKKLVERGIPVCGHLGLLPQSVHKLGGFKTQGKDSESAEQILEDALTIEKAGAQLLVLECVPEFLASEISKKLRIPVIGIGTGNQTDGQVMVCYDILGLTPSIPKFAKNFLQETNSIQQAIANYCIEVRDRVFPSCK